MRRPWWIAALLASPLAAQSPGAIAGSVAEPGSGAPLDGVEVIARGHIAVTGPDGRYRLDGLPPGTIVVRARRIGLQPGEATVELLPGATRRVDFSLAALAVEIAPLAVTGRPAAPSLNREELVGRGSDLASALDGWEGISVRRGSSGEATATVRGGAPDEVVVLVDGFPINDPYTGRADLRRVPTAGVARVTLEPGAGTIRSGGRAVSGVIRVESALGLRPEVAIRGGSDGTVGGSVTVGEAKTQLTVSREGLASSYPYDVPAVRGGGVDQRTNVGGSIWSAQGRWAGPVETILRGSASSRGLPGPVTNPTPTAHASDWSALLGVRTRGRWQLRSSFEMLASRFQDPSPTLGAPYDAHSRGRSATLELGRNLAAGGFEWSAESGFRHDWFSGDGVRSGATFTRGHLLLDGHREIAGVAIAPALRLDHWDGLGHPTPSARIDLSAPLAGAHWNIGFGNGIAAPALADLLFREGNGVRVNPDLEPERIRWEAEAGLRAGMRVAGVPASVSLRGYLGRVKGLILWGLSPGFGFTWMPRNFDVRRAGGELTLTLVPSRGLTLSGTGAVSDIRYDRSGGAQVLYRQRTTGSAAAEWRGGPLSASIRWNWVGQRYPNSSGISPLPAFGLLTAGLEYRLASPLSFRVEGYDLTDTRPAYIAGFPAQGRRASFTLIARWP